MCVLSNALSLLLSPCISCSIFFFFNDTATTEIYTLSLHDALPISLARGAHQDDPRLRGAAHRIASDISTYLRSEIAQKPFRKAQGKTVLDPLSYTPTVFSIEMLAFMPAVQRERAGFLERLAAYFSVPTPRRVFFIQAGKKLSRPLFEILGDPLPAH